jgi:hypothetical protein
MALSGGFGMNCADPPRDRAIALIVSVFAAPERFFIFSSHYTPIHCLWKYLIVRLPVEFRTFFLFHIF